MKQHDYYEYYAFHVSYVHCLMILSTYIAHLFFHGFDQCGRSNMCLEAMFVHSMGYFVSDFVMGEIWRYTDNIFRLHHFFAFWVYYCLFGQNYGYQEMAFGAVIGELSNPCMLLRTILIRRNFTKCLIFEIAQYLFCFVWIFFRIFVAIPVFAINFMCKEGPVSLFFIIGLFGFVSSFWTIKIMLVLTKTLKEKIYKNNPPMIVSCLRTFTVNVAYNIYWKIIFHFVIFWLYCLGPLLIRMIIYNQLFPLIYEAKTYLF